MALIYSLDFKYIHDETWRSILKEDRRYLECMWTHCPNPSAMYVRTCDCDTENDGPGGCEHHGLTPVCSIHLFSELDEITKVLKMRNYGLFDAQFAFSA